MSRATAETLSIRPYREEDEALVLELLTASLGPGPALGRTSEFFRWKHLDNPFGSSVMLVAEDGGRVVGLRAFMRWEFRTGSETVRAVRAVDTATHPDHQGRGIFSRLTREALEILRRDTDLVFNTPNEKSGPGYLKLGWRPVGRLGMSVRPRRPRLPGHTAGSPSAETAPAATVLDDPRLSELLGRAERDERRLETERSLSFLRWRYGEAPLDYRAVPDEIGGELSGVAFLRVRPRGRLWQTSIGDVIVPSGDLGAARRLIRAASRSAPSDFVACRLPTGSTAARGAATLGFVRAPGGIRFVVNPLRDGILPDPADLKSWALRLGDVEVF
jgi:GNAT superfamily N-acetyltransferase